MNKPLTIKEYAVSQGLSETTVRRRIRAGGLDARLEHGRYFIYGQNGDSFRLLSCNEEIRGYKY